MSVLVLAEHDNTRLSNATRRAVTAALQCGADIAVLVAGHQCQTAAVEAAHIAGVEKVLIADDPLHVFPLAEHIAPLVVSLSPAYAYILAPATSMGKDILPRIAALLDCAMLSDVTGIDANHVFMRPIYAGNAYEKVALAERIKIMTIRPAAFAAAMDVAAANTGLDDKIERIIPQPHHNPYGAGGSEFLCIEQHASTRPELNAARIIIAAGRGVGSVENFHKIEQLADSIGAAVGASRASVDSGYAPNDLQIGQTGKIVAPELYIAVGISGAIQHLAGMKESKTIIAINKDENAPIFEIADYGLVADWQETLPQLIESLKARHV